MSKQNNLYYVKLNCGWDCDDCGAVSISPSYAWRYYVEISGNEFQREICAKCKDKKISDGYTLV